MDHPFLSLGSAGNPWIACGHVPACTGTSFRWLRVGENAEAPSPHHLQTPVTLRPWMRRPSEAGRWLGTRVRGKAIRVLRHPRLGFLRHPRRLIGVEGGLERGGREGGEASHLRRKGKAPEVPSRPHDHRPRHPRNRLLLAQPGCLEVRSGSSLPRSPAWIR